MYIEERRRQLMLRLVDNHTEAHMFIFLLESYNRREEIYKWLLTNGFTGKRLVELFAEFGHSHLQVAKFVMTQIDRFKKEQIFVGKDIV